MAIALIRSADLEAGRVPGVCAKTGEPATTTVRLGRAQLPATLAVAARVERARQAGYSLFALATATTILAVITKGALAKAAVLAWAFALAVRSVLRVLLWVGARADGDDVRLTRVDPSFARAAGRIYRGR